jgi:hypothetical protein
MRKELFDLLMENAFRFSARSCLQKLSGLARGVRRGGKFIRAA